MYSTCLSCTRDLGTNDAIELLPIGRRIAFDANQGRLWVVCSSCGKWNLVPFDNRLECIDACERLFRDTPTRFSTDQIGLARVREGLDLVRIGAPQRPEFASWRYGSEYRRRRRRAMAVSGVAMVGGSAGYFGLHTLLTGGASGHGSGVAATIVVVNTLFQGANWANTYVHGRRMKLKTVHPQSGKPVTLRASGMRHAHILPEGDTLVLQVKPRFFSGEFLQFSGEAAEQLTRRILGRINMLHGTNRQLKAAVDKVPALISEEHGSLLRAAFNAGAVRVGLGTPTDLIKVPVRDRLALEMFGNESDERRWLTGELALLERQWREAEELAKITDSLAVSDDVDRLVGMRKT